VSHSQLSTFRTENLNINAPPVCSSILDEVFNNLSLNVTGSSPGINLSSLDVFIGDLVDENSFLEETFIY
jgi:hypothetical protein